MDSFAIISSHRSGGVTALLSLLRQFTSEKNYHIPQGARTCTMGVTAHQHSGTLKRALRTPPIYHKLTHLFYLDFHRRFLYSPCVFFCCSKCFPSGAVWSGGQFEGVRRLVNRYSRKNLGVIFRTVIPGQFRVSCLLSKPLLPRIPSFVIPALRFAWPGSHLFRQVPESGRFRSSPAGKPE